MLESINSFYEKEKYFKTIYKSYLNKLDHFYDQAKSQSVKKEYARGGKCIHRGFYCPSPVHDMIIGGCKRGRLIKNPRKQPDYEYYFDKNGQLIMAKKFADENNIPPSIELLFYNSDSVITHPKGQLLRLMNFHAILRK